MREWNACIYVRIRARAHFLLSQFGVPVWFVIFGLHVFVTLSVVSHSCKYSGREQKKIDKISLHIFTSSGLMKTLCVTVREYTIYYSEILWLCLLVQNPSAAAEFVRRMPGKNTNKMLIGVCVYNSFHIINRCDAATQS